MRNSLTHMSGTELQVYMYSSIIILYNVLLCVACVVLNVCICAFDPRVWLLLSSDPCLVGCCSILILNFSDFYSYFLPGILGYLLYSTAPTILCKYSIFICMYIFMYICIRMCVSLFRKILLYLTIITSEFVYCKVFNMLLYYTFK